MSIFMVIPQLTAEILAFAEVFYHLVLIPTNKTNSRIMFGHGKPILIYIGSQLTILNVNGFTVEYTKIAFEACRMTRDLRSR